MEVKVEIPKMRKVVRLEVDPGHSLDSILEIICRDLGLGRKESWGLMWHDVETSDYSRTIRQLGVREGDSFQLVKKARLPPQIAVPPKKIEISRRRYLKYAAASTTVVAIVAAGYGIYEATKPTPTTPTPTPTPTPIPTPTLTPTPTPTPEPFDFLFETEPKAFLGLWWGEGWDRRDTLRISISLLRGEPQKVSLTVEGLPPCCSHYFSVSEGFPPFESELVAELEPSYRGRMEKYEILLTARSARLTKNMKFELLINEIPVIYANKTARLGIAIEMGHRST